MTTIKSLVADIETCAQEQGIPFDAELKQKAKAAVKEHVEAMAARLGVRPAWVMSRYGHLFVPTHFLRAALVAE